MLGSTPPEKFEDMSLTKLIEDASNAHTPRGSSSTYLQKTITLTACIEYLEKNGITAEVPSSITTNYEYLDHIIKSQQSEKTTLLENPYLLADERQQLNKALVEPVHIKNMIAFKALEKQIQERLLSGMKAMHPTRRKTPNPNASPSTSPSVSPKASPRGSATVAVYGDALTPNFGRLRLGSESPSTGQNPGGTQNAPSSPRICITDADQELPTPSTATREDPEHKKFGL